MPIATNCPNCKALFKLANEMAGKKVKCQKCDTLFVVPKPTTSMTMPGVPAAEKPAPKEAPSGHAPMPLPPMPMNPPDASPRAEEEDNDDDRPRPKAKKSNDEDRRPPLKARRAKPKAGSGMLPILLAFLGLGVLSCVACSGAGAIWFFAAREPARIRNDNPNRDLAKNDGNKNRPFNGGDDKFNFPQPPAPANAIQAILGPDGSFRQNNQLTQFDPRTIDGKLHKAYIVRLEANRTYQIDMMSNNFDSFLYLVDEFGNDIAEDDDSGGGLNARIVFTPFRTGNFRIEATSLRGNQIGPYVFAVTRIR